MTYTIRFAAPLSITALALALAACGGGGSSSPAASGTPTAASSITADNMQDVGAQGWASASSFGSVSSGSAGSLVTGVAVNAGKPNLLNAVLDSLYAANSAQPANQVVGVTNTQTVACAGGGNMLVTVNMSSSTPSAGDSISVDANACVEHGQTVGGKLTFTFNSISGTPGQSVNWSGSFGLSFTNFSIAENGDSVTANGAMTINITQTASSTASVTVSGSSLNLSEHFHTGTSASLAMSNFTEAVSLTPKVDSASMNYALAGTLPKIGNASYSVKTLSDFKQSAGALYPYQGALKITASDNSSVTVTAVDSTNVRLDLDKNGDSVTDQSVTTTWAALEARL